LVESEILNAQKTGHRKCVEVFDKKGNKIQVTDNHKFLTKNKKHGSIYTEIKYINNAFTIPSQLKYKRDKYTLTIDKLSSKIIKKDIGRRNIYDLTTSTGNFIANGFIVHNCGTFGEAYEGFKNKIPIYVLKTMDISDYPVTFIGWVYSSGGDFFDSQEKLLTYLDKKYKLTAKG
jgi:intein/homing endonuclease